MRKQLINKLFLHFGFSLLLFCLACSGSKQAIQRDSQAKISQREQETGVQIARKTKTDYSDWVDGRFTIGTTTTGQKLLYGYPAPNSTSHTVIKVDDFLAANDPGIGTYLLGPQRIDDFSYEVAWTFRQVSIVQRLTPMLKNDRGMVWIQYHIKNIDTIAHSVGLLLELDTMIGSNDAAPLASSSGIIERETQYLAEDVPDFFHAYEMATAFHTLTGQGLLYSAGATPPDLMIAGDWGRLKAVNWDEYQSRSRHYGDSAVLYRWDPQILQPGDSLFIGTYYGLGSSFSGQFEDMLVKLNGPGEINFINNELVPNPFEVVVIAINTGSNPLNNLVADLKLPEGIEFAPGQTTPKSMTPDYLTKEKMCSASWKLQLTGTPAAVQNFNLAVEITHANSRSNPAVLAGQLKFDPEFRIKPAPDIRLVMASRSTAQMVTIHHLQVQVIDDETGQPITAGTLKIEGPDTSYALHTDSQGEGSLSFRREMNNLTKLNFNIEYPGYLPLDRTEELGRAVGDTASKEFRLIRNEFEFCGQLKSSNPETLVTGGRLVLTNADTTIEIAADEQGRFSRVIKKYLQPERNAYRLYVYPDNHFFFIENLEFLVPRQFKQNRDFTLPRLENGAKVILFNVFYEQYRYFLTMQTFPELFWSVEYIKKHPNLVFEIGGHTSSPGSSSYNQWLSERRAEGVRDFYVGLGIPETSLRIRGYGEDFPIATNLTGEGQAQNRRVELKIVEINP